MNTNTATPRKQEPIRVTRADLPLSCPRPADELWNMHPRVYLPIEKDGEAVCPYCGAHYVLGD
ncbi:MAG: zinc-finger domain-containing protein [Gammaproteobacteria bacterium]|nr:zinc-finger domain-containing protein [Gammaproteobacteria bacterium]